LPVNIAIPEDAEPGGLYGAALVKVEPESAAIEAEEGKTESQISIASRIAVLFFVRIRGNAKEEGRLLSFDSDQDFYQKGPVKFSLNFENTGKVHLNPYATIEIKNLMGKKVDEIDIAPWFVMPGFNRGREAEWNKGLAFGRYTATIKLNRGYGDIVDEMQASFWIIPTKVLAVSLAVILVLAIIIVWFSSKFELKRK
jgi:hypothetical protein